MWTFWTRARRNTLTLATTISLAATAALAEWDADAAWRLLASVDITETIDGDLWRATKAFPPDLVAATDGFEIEGYVVPIEAEAYISTLILVQDPADCPFCGNSGYGPVLEVHLKAPIRDLPEFSRLRVSGDLVLIRDPETIQAYVLREAIPVQSD